MEEWWYFTERLSNDIQVAENQASFHQYLCYYQKCGNVVFDKMLFLVKCGNVVVVVQSTNKSNNCSMPWSCWLTLYFLQTMQTSSRTNNVQIGHLSAETAIEYEIRMMAPCKLNTMIPHGLMWYINDIRNFLVHQSNIWETLSSKKDQWILRRDLSF